MVPINDGTTRNILTHYGQVSLENTRTHAATYVNTPTRDAQDNDMFYYFLSDSLTNEFHTTVLLYMEMYTVTNVPVASSLLKQIIILIVEFWGLPPLIPLLQCVNRLGFEICSVNSCQLEQGSLVTLI